MCVRAKQNTCTQNSCLTQSSYFWSRISRNECELEISTESLSLQQFKYIEYWFNSEDKCRSTKGLLYMLVCKMHITQIIYELSAMEDRFLKLPTEVCLCFEVKIKLIVLFII